MVQLSRVQQFDVEKKKHHHKKTYKSLTPPWKKSWLAVCLSPFRAKTTNRKEKETLPKIDEAEEPKSQSRVLQTFKSAFPFQFFPDQLIVEEKRVIWKDWMGPGLYKAISIMASDISNVQGAHGPFLGHIHVGSLVGGPEICIQHLWRKDVVRARALIEGIILAARERASVRREEVEEEQKELSQLGKVKF